MSVLLSVCSQESPLKSRNADDLYIQFISKNHVSVVLDAPPTMLKTITEIVQYRCRFRSGQSR